MIKKMGNIKEQIIKKIQNIELPDTDAKYKKSSADGYAFLGWGLNNLGIENSYLLDCIVERHFSLNAPHNILGTKLTKDNVYAYTLWTCYEYVRSLDNKHLVDIILHKFNSVGEYDNGWQRYCSEEINYRVPNVTSAACRMNIDNNVAKAEKFFNLLKDNQRNGNWDYFIVTKDGLQYRCQEDSMHLAMMLYQLYRVKEHLYDADMITAALRALLKTDETWLQEGSIGWGVPWTLLVYHVYKEDILNLLDPTRYNARCSIVYNKTIDYLDHPNFRVRAMSAWVLSEIIGDQT